MTMKIIWRLKEQPTSDKISLLVDRGILTKDEAREILFSSQEETERDVKSLEAEIKFLRELVEKLSQNRSQIVEVIKEVQVPYNQYPWWNPYITWCGTTSLIGTSGNYNLTSLTGNTSNIQGFSQIQTF